MKTIFFNRIITLLSFILVLINIIYVIYQFHLLPKIVSSHYNLIGNADSQASKFLIILLPIISILTYFSFGYILKKPGIINFPIEVTEKNRENLYSIAITLINLMRFLIVSLLLFLSISIINNEINGIKHINIYVVYVFIFLILLTLIIGISRMYKFK